MNRLVGKKVFVTAAGQGIGRACAERFAHEGAQVVATDKNTDVLSAWASSHENIQVESLDALDREQIFAAAARHPDVTTLMNVAGFVHHGNVLDATEDEWDFAMDLNARSMFRTIQAFLPNMLAHGKGGSVINISSVASVSRGLPNRFVYGVSKAAVQGLTKSVAADFIAHKIRCNAILPGTVQSPSLEDRINALPGSYEENRAAFIARQPMGRLGEAHEIASLAAYLASDESEFMTGQSLSIDGGMTV